MGHISLIQAERSPYASLSDLGPSGAVETIEASDAAFLMRLGTVGGGTVRDDHRLRWVIGGSPVDYHNCVVQARLASNEVEPAIDEVIQQFRAHRVPGTWHIGPSSRPVDLGDRLRQRGFTGGWSDVGMASDLHALPDNVPVPAGLVITRVRDRQALAAWAQARALDPEGELESNWVAETYARIGLGDEVPWRHYVGWLGRRPVATATLLLAAGVAGVYFVLTVPEVRRQGIGTAITLAALLEARALGYGVGVLGASEMGRSIYRRLGFGEYCRVAVYEWPHDAAVAA